MEKYRIKLILILSLFVFNLFAKDLNVFLKTEKKDRSKILNNYKEVQSNFFKKTCNPNDEAHFKTLTRNNRGDGIYIPLLEEGKVDTFTITKNLPLLERKLFWIEKQIRYLKKGKYDEKLVLKRITNLENALKSNLELKKELFIDKKKISSEKMKLNIKNLNKHYHNYLDVLPHFKMMTFPVNYLELRRDYEIAKESGNKKLINDLFFRRKILEDGAINKSRTNDKFFRASLSTLFFNLKYEQNYIKEKNRFDLEDVISKSRTIVKKGKKYSLNRLEEWRARVKRRLKYYQNILLLSSDDLQGLGKKRFLASRELESFVNKKFVEVYQFWMNQKEVLRALFVLETILYNEVGNYEKGKTSERSDITQVVWNRVYGNTYNQLGEVDLLYRSLLEKGINSIENRWLNTLFKKGEFSFTYYFIEGSLRVFCPSKNRLARKLRNENLNIAIKTLELTDKKFRGVRYFSRASMFGKVDMSSVWSEFKEIPERVGEKINGSLLGRVKKGYYSAYKKYFYHFISVDNQLYEVFKLKKGTYVKSTKGEDYFHYRSPHFFRYFIKGL